MNILFVCTGNTCRSPMAEYLFNHRAGDSEHRARSAGLAAWPGEPINDHAQTVLAQNYSIEAGSHRARRVHEHLIEESDLVLTMNGRQRDHLRHLLPDMADKVRTIGEAAGQPEVEIEDPFGRDEQAYRITAGQLDDLIGKIIASLDQSTDRSE